jgi:glycosyltransferase 2 family protein
MSLLKFPKKRPFVFIVAVIILYVGFALYSDIGNLSKAPLKIDYWDVPLILAFMSAQILLLAFRFHRLLKALDINIPLKRNILIYITGLSLAVTPGSSGQIIKSQIIKKQFGYSISKTSPIILIEKWNELTSVLLILLIFTLVNAMFESTLIIIIGTIVALFLFGLMRTHTFFNLFKKLILRIRRLRVLEESIENSQESLKILSSKRAVLEGFVITTPAKIFEAASVFFAFQALGIKIGFITSTQIFFTSLVSGILSFVPGGFGVAEGSMLALLIKYYGKDLALLAAAVIFVRLATIWYATFLGILTGQFIMKYEKILSGQS